MYVLCHEFHYTPDQVRNMDMYDYADLVSMWQAVNGSTKDKKKPRSKGERIPIEDQVMQNIEDQLERNRRKGGVIE
jgi:hypothetical protein